MADDGSRGTVGTVVRVDERHARPQPVECARCGATVLVAKFSPQHTSVQWAAAAAAACAEFRARAAEGTRGALVEGCGTLRDGIDAALASGRLAVAPPTYERGNTSSARPLPGNRGEGDPGD
jgi:hypothetical protein